MKKIRKYFKIFLFFIVFTSIPVALGLLGWFLYNWDSSHVCAFFVWVISVALEYSIIDSLIDEIRELITGEHEVDYRHRKKQEKFEYSYREAELINNNKPIKTYKIVTNLLFSGSNFTISIACIIYFGLGGWIFLKDDLMSTIVYWIIAAGATFAAIVYLKREIEVIRKK
jgi:hypothetical protein